MVKTWFFPLKVCDAKTLLISFHIVQTGINIIQREREQVESQSFVDCNEDKLEFISSWGEMNKQSTASSKTFIDLLYFDFRSALHAGNPSFALIRRTISNQIAAIDVYVGALVQFN